MNKNIHICHCRGDKLEEFYKKADIGLLYFKPNPYSDMAMPFKTFEYLGHGLPMITSDTMAAGEFVKKEDIGWTIEYSEKVLQKLLLDILEHKSEIIGKRNNIKKLIPKNTWIERAKTVERDLCLANRDK